MLSILDLLWKLDVTIQIVQQTLLDVVPTVGQFLYFIL